MPSHILKWGPSIALLFAGGAGPLFAQDAPWGLPPGQSTISGDVDHLYRVILWITGITFIGVQGLLLYFCIRYRRRPGGRPGYTHGNNTAEIIWTVSPALVLVFIALYQYATWKAAKIDKPDLTKEGVIQIHVAAKTFEWQFRYAGPNGQFGDDDDMQVGKNFWLPVGATAYMPMRSIDVIHSFFLFQMRVKQDVVPGLRNHVWFTPKGFYVAKIDKGAALWRPDYRNLDWRPKDTHKKWEGEFKFDLVTSDADFEKRFGDKFVAIDNRFTYQDGLMRATSDAMTALTLKGGEIKKGTPWRDVDYAIVPFEGTCAELCGNLHFTMNFGMYVLPRKAYDYFMAMDDYTPDQSADYVNFMWQNWRK
jgi:cytochrome c oxidase subunit 2